MRDKKVYQHFEKGKIGAILFFIINFVSYNRSSYSLIVKIRFREGFYAIRVQNGDLSKFNRCQTLTGRHFKLS